MLLPRSEATRQLRAGLCNPPRRSSKWYPATRGGAERAAKSHASERLEHLPEGFRAFRVPQALGAPTDAGALLADVARGNGPPRLGSVRRDPRDRRRLRRPPELRNGHRRPGARGARFSRWNHFPARLAL